MNSNTLQFLICAGTSHEPDPPAGEYSINRVCSRCGLYWDMRNALDYREAVTLLKEDWTLKHKWHK